MSETFLFWGLCAIWALIAAYLLWMIVRLGKLRHRVERLERQLGSGD